MKLLRNGSWFSQPFPLSKLTMRLTALLLFSVLFGLQANDSYAQQTKLTLDMDNATLSKVIDEIEASSDFRFVYSNKQIDVDRKVSLKVKKAKIDEILQILFDHTSIEYAIRDTQILLKEGAQVNPDKDDNPQPQFSVSGTVTDENGAPLPGVTVIVKGTSRGTAVDFEGNYQIIVPNEASILMFTSIGYSTQEITVGNQRTIDVQMKEDVSELDEVVVNAGYYKTSEKLRTGNISRITADDIEKQPVTNVMAALIGRMPGVNIQQLSGLAGGGFSIRIRGQNSLRDGANEPLYIVDGVPFTANTMGTDLSLNVFRNTPATPLNTINPSDIESIEVLKDADATAIYGSRGANGVVLITTKKGTIGKTKVNFTYQNGMARVANFVDLLNIDQHTELRKEALNNDGIEPRSFDYDVNGTWDPNRNMDWQKRLLGGTSKITNAQLSVSGGNQNTQYSFNGAYLRQTSVFPGDFVYHRGSGKLSVNHKSDNQRFNTVLSITYSKDENNLPTQDLSPIALGLSPNAPEPFNLDGSINWADGTWGFAGSPFVHLKRPFLANTENMVINSVLSYELFPGLRLKSNAGYTSTGFNERVLTPISSLDPAGNSVSGNAQYADSSVSTWILEPMVEYQRKVDNGNLNILLGGTFQEDIRKLKTITAIGIGSDALLENLGSATSLRGTSNYSQYKYNAVYGRINYEWKTKYIVNLTGRRDGSSRFGPGKRFGNFWAIGGAWVFTNEGFTKDNLPILSFGKLRTSYGTTGNDQIGDYQYMDTHGSDTYLNQTILFPTRLVNRNYSWEVNKKFEVGLEFGLFNDRIYLSTSHYRNRSSNQLVGFSLPAITGFTSVQANLPATVQNRGWELELITRNIQSKDFNWTTSANLTIPRNELVNYPDLESSPYANRYLIGEPLNIAKTYKYLGVDPQTGNYQFEDTDGDGNLSSPNDRHTIVETGQQYFGGIKNSLNYKNLQLDFYVHFVKQRDRTYRNSFGAPGFATNQPIEVMDRWQQSGDISEIGRPSASDFAYSNQYRDIYLSSDKGYEDASFIRFSNISLSWNLPSDFTKKLRLQQARIFFQGQNLWTITGFRGLDPETGYSSLPPLRTITTGIQFAF